MKKTKELVLHSKSTYIAAQKGLFCRAKEPILQCKTVITNWLYDTIRLEKSLQLYRLNIYILQYF